MSMVDADSTPHTTIIKASHRRAPNRFKAKPARHAEEHTAEREDPRAQAKDRVAEVESVLELELREAHVHAVQIGEP
jgi:hypothetical protein